MLLEGLVAELFVQLGTEGLINLDFRFDLAFEVGLIDNIIIS